jgi:hypothetical protein
LGCDETLVGNIIAPVVSNIVAIDPKLKLSPTSQLAGTNRIWLYWNHFKVLKVL